MGRVSNDPAALAERQRLVASLGRDPGLSAAEIAAEIGVCARTVVRYRQRLRAGLPPPTGKRSRADKFDNVNPEQ